MKLLFAEDDPDVSRSVTALLTRSHYSVDPVYNGNDALTYLTDGDYDACIMDIMMPGMNGDEVVRKARAAGSQVPVIMLTAMGEVEDRINGLDAGADDYLAKPSTAENCWPVSAHSCAVMNPILRTSSHTET